MMCGDTSAGLEEVLRGYLQHCQWFSGQGGRILSLTRLEALAVTEEPPPAYLTLYQVEYAERDPEIYVLPLAFATGADAEELVHQCRQAVIARFGAPDCGGEGLGVLYDAMWNARVVSSLTAAVVRRRRLRGQAGTLQGTWAAAGAQARVALLPPTMPISAPREESNTTVVPAAPEAWGRWAAPSELTDHPPTRCRAVG